MYLITSYNDRTFANTHKGVGAAACEGMQRAWGFGREMPTLNLISSAPNNMTMGKLAHLSTQL